MKKIYLKTLLLALISLYLHAQQATVIDSKSITLARYTNLAAIQTAIPAPQTGMQVYNTGTATNWFYNGSSWVNLAMATTAPAEPEGFGSWGCDSPGLKAYQPVGMSSGILVAQNFGQAVAISGNYAIVGMKRAATFYKLNVNTGIWEEKTTVFPTTSQATDDYYGSNVAISGDYAMISASYENINGFNATGSVSVYKRNTSTDVWEFQTKLINTGQGTDDRFGASLSMFGQYAIIGAQNDDVAGFVNCGSASVFKLNTSTNTWLLEQQIFDSSPVNENRFGYDVAIDGNLIFIGRSGNTSGDVSIYNRNGSLPSPWTIEQTINGSKFGNEMAISGDYAIVSNRTSSGYGEVFLYQRQLSFFGYYWIQVKEILNYFSAYFDSSFGYSVKMAGDYLIIGAAGYDTAIFQNCGRFEVYKRNGKNYTLISNALNPGAENNHYLGGSVAIDSNGRFIVGGEGDVLNGNTQGTAVFGKVK